MTSSWNFVPGGDLRFFSREGEVRPVTCETQFAVFIRMPPNSEPARRIPKVFPRSQDDSLAVLEALEHDSAFRGSKRWLRSLAIALRLGRASIARHDVMTCALVRPGEKGIVSSLVPFELFQNGGVRPAHSDGENFATLSQSF